MASKRLAIKGGWERNEERLLFQNFSSMHYGNEHIFNSGYSQTKIGRSKHSSTRRN
jgi:hypothetical protein